MGLSEDPGTVCIRGDERIISKVLKKTDGSHKNVQAAFRYCRRVKSTYLQLTRAATNGIFQNKEFPGSIRRRLLRITPSGQ